jgi:hypothetical protein
VTLKEGKRRVYRAIRVLVKKGVLEYDSAPVGRCDDHGNVLTNTYTLTKLLVLDHGVPFPLRAKVLKEQMAKLGLSLKKIFRNPLSPAPNTVRAAFRGESVNSHSLEAIRQILSLKASDIPND